MVHTVYWHSGWGEQWYIQYTGIQAGEGRGNTVYWHSGWGGQWYMYMYVHYTDIQPRQNTTAVHMYMYNYMQVLFTLLHVYTCMSAFIIVHCTCMYMYMYIHVHVHVRV